MTASILMHLSLFALGQGMCMYVVFGIYVYVGEWDRYLLNIFNVSDSLFSSFQSFSFHTHKI